MPVQNYKSKQQADDYRKYPIDDHGKLRIQYFEVEATPIIGDAGSTFELCELPPGRIRIIPNLSRFNISAQGAARTMDIGHLEYQSRPVGNDAIPADPDAIAFDIDVAAAKTGQQISTATKFDIYSQAGVVVTAQINDGTTPQGTVLSGFLIYVYE